VEHHDENDPRDTDDAWKHMAAGWSDIGNRLRTRYHDVVGDDGPSEAEVRHALRTLGTAAQAVVDSLGSAIRDPEIRSQVKEAAADFASVVGQTFSDLGREINNMPVDDDESTAADDGDGSTE
jgi:hypothetical protein